MSQYVNKLMHTFLFIETILMFATFAIDNHQFNVNENLIPNNIIQKC